MELLLLWVDTTSMGNGPLENIAKITKKMIHFPVRKKRKEILLAVDTNAKENRQSADPRML